jgi:Pyruvate/2-oxoacid:ferredoxin oxidoreductase gamma subunit
VIYDSSLFEVGERVTGVEYYGVEATRIAQDLGAPQASNIVMLGALSRATRIFPINALGNAVRERFPKSAEINLRALKAGAEIVNP